MLFPVELATSNRMKASLQAEEHFYLKISKENSSVTVVSKDIQPEKGHHYRLVHKIGNAIDPHTGSSYYVDPDFTVVKNQFPKDKVIVRRLNTLYGISNLPPFLDISRKPTHLPDNQHAPHCIREIGLFETRHYKTLFITQDYQQSGKYILVANINGRFEVVSVDDRIPVRHDTLEPLWGFSYDNPWELILLKAYAKILGGYDKLLVIKPFAFAETWSHNTWKVFHLGRDSQKFLKHYYQSKKFRNGKIIIKSKSDAKVVKYGITPDSASYEIIAIHQQQRGDSSRFILTIRSTDFAKYLETNLNFYHPDSQSYRSQGLTLDHDTLISDKKFLDMFSTAYITSVRQDDFISGYKILDIEKYQRKAQHFEFSVKKQSFFDFSIVQFPQNKAVEDQNKKLFLNQFQLRMNMKSQISNVDLRYLQLKYILVRDNNSNDFQSQKEKQSNEEDLGFSKMKAVQGDSGFPLPRFTVFQTQHFKGYAKGTAHFIRLDPGRYILRFKSENVAFDTRYVVNWTCQQQIDFRPAKLTVEQETDILHDSMVSIMHKYPNFSLKGLKKTQMITYADAFDQTGCGFVCVKCSRECNRSIIVEVDPKLLHEEGYRLKGKYKVHSDNFKKFAIKIDSHSYDAIVFKKRLDIHPQDIEWPLQSIKIYVKELKKPQDLSDNYSVET